MRALLFLLALLLGSPAFAQQVTCATRPVGDNTNSCASTAFVFNSQAVQLPAASTIQLFGGTGTAGSASVITLGTNLSITSGILNASGSGGTPIIPAYTILGNNSGSPVAAFSLSPAQTLAMLPLGDLTNLFSNSQFRILSKDLVLSNKIGPSSATTESTCAISGFTPGVQAVTFNISSGCTQLRTNDLLFLVSGLDSNFQINSSGQSTLLRTTSVTGTPPTSFTSEAPRGYIPPTSYSGVLQPADMADLSGATADWAMKWGKSVGLAFWPDDYAADIEPGCERAGAFYMTSSVAMASYQVLETRVQSRLSGKTITANFRVKQQIKGGSGTSRAFVTVNGATTYGSSLVGSGSYEDAQITITLPTTLGLSDTVLAGVEYDGATHDLYYMCEPHLAVVQSLPSHFYAPPRDEYFIPNNTLNLASYIGAAITLPSYLDATTVFYSMPIDFYGESQGWIYYTVPAIQLNSEFRASIVGAPVGYRNILGTSAAGTNIVYGPVAYTQIVAATGVAGAVPGMTTTNGPLLLSDGIAGTPIGYGVAYTQIQSLPIVNYSIDIVGYKLSN